jgi:hypothetical protein
MSDVALYSGELIVMSLERVGTLNDYRKDEGIINDQSVFGVLAQPIAPLVVRDLPTEEAVRIVWLDPRATFEFISRGSE